MSVLLQLDCSPQRYSRSISRQITAHGSRVWQQRKPQGVVLYRDLTKTPLMPLGQSWVDGKLFSTLIEVKSRASLSHNRRIL